MAKDREPVGRFRRSWWILLLVPLLLAGGFVAWAASPAEPLPPAASALVTSADADGVAVASDAWTVFQPITEETSSGLIFYPGGRVDSRAYAPAARAIAAQGYTVVVVPMPLNFAFLAPDRATDVMASFPTVSHWAVGGHSLGGAMAARYAFQNRAAVNGLVLWAAYPAASNDLSSYDMHVVSVYATQDGLATLDDIEASRRRLPPDTRWVAIEGGNHAQFGWYGRQKGDGNATISRSDQQRQMVNATVDLLQELSR